MPVGTTDGTPCKTVKDKLMHELEKDVEPLAQVDFVCDQYPVQSIKNCERERYAMGGTQVIHITRPDLKTPK